MLNRLLNYVVPVVVFFSMLVFTISSCQMTSHQQSNLTGHIVSISNLRWPNPKDIPVCWEEVGNDALSKVGIQKVNDIKQSIPKTIESVFEAVGFKFTGWQDCSTSSEGARVNLTLGGSYTRGQGFGVNGRQNGVNIAVDGYYPWCVDQGTNLVKPLCINNMSVHEFGHVLGLHHEMDRTDNFYPGPDPRCEYAQVDGEGIPEATQIGNYDSQSIMTYCRMFDLEKQQEPIQLSAGDRRALKSLYDGTFVRFSGQPVLYSDVAAIDIAPYGDGIKKYRYKIGSSDKSDFDCTKDSGYSSSRDVTKHIIADISNFPEGVAVKVCAVGLRSNGDWQDTDDYSSVTWIKDQSPKTNVDLQNEFLSRTDTLQASVTGSGIVAYRVKIVPYRNKSTNERFRCYEEDGYGTTRQITESISVDLGSFDFPMTYVLCVRGKNANGHWQSLPSATKKFFNVEQ